ncbi:MAG: carbamoyltransferase C-terminal domain-containing protein, partial [Pseudomonadota bacterium]
GAYLGPRWDDAACEAALAEHDAVWRRVDDDALFNDTANALDAGEVVGWFQGAMEFGPRALGHRSILGDPRSATMQSTMNLKIKNRESFRPFAPAVLAERAAEVFDMAVDSPYMLHVAKVRDELRRTVDDSVQGFDRLAQARSTLPAITHVDDTARVQTVHRETNPRFHMLIDAFAQRTGIPVLINTSFNVRGEPIVCTPQDAYRCFMATDMDRLVIGNLVLVKAEQPAAAAEWARSVTFAPD